MFPTFVIGLREGLEAALIVGIVLAFLKQRGRPDLIRSALLGVAAAIVLCVGIGVVLEVVSSNLPQRQQEGLETVVGAVAIAMVTYMVIWMRRHSRDLKGQLEGAAADAVASGSGMALVFMAFLAVLREGFETAVFLIAAFNESDSGASAGAGAVLGIAVAVLLGYGIYRGGVKINLSKFFRATGIILVLVAAGLVVSALHTAHEAGWLNSGQQHTLDLTAITRPGSVQSSLLTGMLGIQDRPVRIELVGWLLYLIPLGTYVLWPSKRQLSRATARRCWVGGVAAAVVLAVALTLTAPAVTTGPRALTDDGMTYTPAANSLVIAGTGTSGPAVGTVTADKPGTETHLGLTASKYIATTSQPSPASGPATATLATLAEQNNGRLPLGLAPSGTPVSATADLSYVRRSTVTWWLEPTTGRLLDVQWQQSVRTNAQYDKGQTVALGSGKTSSGAVAEATAIARATSITSDLSSRIDQHSQHQWSAFVGVLALLMLLGGLTYEFAGNRASRSRDDAGAQDRPDSKLLVS